ncbi:MAG: hypothetical protein AB7U29_18225 [Desulfobulbus sp.]
MITEIGNTVFTNNQFVNETKKQQNKDVTNSDKIDNVAKYASVNQTDPVGMQPDEYVKSEDRTEEVSGLYRLEIQNGNKVIVLDDTESKSNGKRAESVKEQENVNEASEESKKTVSSKKDDNKNDDMICICDTSRVDGEIKSLNEEKKQIEQQIKNCQGDAEKRKKLEQQLSAIKAELNVKDNDNYRKQNASFTSFSQSS